KKSRVVLALRPVLLLRDLLGNTRVRIQDDVLELVAEQRRLPGRLSDDDRHAQHFASMLEDAHLEERDVDEDERSGGVERNLAPARKILFENALDLVHRPIELRHRQLADLAVAENLAVGLIGA